MIMNEIAFQPNRLNAADQPPGSRFERFRKKCKKGEGWWTCKRNAKPGDLYLFWFGGDVAEIVALGIVDGECEQEDNGWYECNFRPLVLLPSPISLDEIHSDELLMKWWKTKPQI